MPRETVQPFPGFTEVKTLRLSRPRVGYWLTCLEKPDGGNTGNHLHTASHAPAAVSILT